MATVIGKVAAVFSASTSGLTAGCDKAGASMRKLQRDVSGLRSGMNLLGAIQGAQLFGQVASAATSAARSLIGMGSAQAEVIDNTSKLAARLGMTYGEFAGLALAGDLAGVGMDTLAAAATKADLAFVKAANGSKPAIAAFERIGLSVEDLNGLSAAERFDAIAASIAALPTEAERAAAAVAIFGKAGAQLLPLFAGGADGIAQARAEAERFGLTLTNTQGTQVEAMNDAFTRASAAINGVIQQLVAYLAPAIEAVTTTFSDFIGSVGGANIGQAIGDALLQGAQFFAEVADSVIARFGDVFGLAAATFDGAAAVFDVFGRIVSALQAVWYTGEAVFKGVAALIARTISLVAGALDMLPDAVAGSGWGEFGRSMQASANQLSAGADAAAANAAAAAGNMFAAKPAAPAGVGPGTGPLSQMVADARRSAQDAAAQVDVANRERVGAKPAVVSPPEVATQAIKATDSTSKEGIAEMFRLLRGDTGNDIQERQLSALERIADNTAGGGDEFTEAALAAF